MATKAWLEGHPVDLAAVAALLPEGDVRVVRDADNEGRYYLTALARIGGTAYLLTG
jgi:hypothetical protein